MSSEQWWLSGGQEGKLSGLFCAVLCAITVQSAVHRNLKRHNSCLLVRFKWPILSQVERKTLTHSISYCPCSVDYAMNSFVLLNNAPTTWNGVIMSVWHFRQKMLKNRMRRVVSRILQSLGSQLRKCDLSSDWKGFKQYGTIYLRCVVFCESWLQQRMYFCMNDKAHDRTRVFVCMCVHVRLWCSATWWRLELSHRYPSSWDLVLVWLWSFDDNHILTN